MSERVVMSSLTEIRLAANMSTLPVVLVSSTSAAAAAAIRYPRTGRLCLAGKSYLKGLKHGDPAYLVKSSFGVDSW